jgi:hypothetical protein
MSGLEGKAEAPRAIFRFPSAISSSLTRNKVQDSARSGQITFRRPECSGECPCACQKKGVARSTVSSRREWGGHFRFRQERKSAAAVSACLSRCTGSSATAQHRRYREPPASPSSRGCGPSGTGHTSSTRGRARGDEWTWGALVGSRPSAPCRNFTFRLTVALGAAARDSATFCRASHWGEPNGAARCRFARSSSDTADVARSFDRNSDLDHTI